MCCSILYENVLQSTHVIHRFGMHRFHYPWVTNSTPPTLQIQPELCSSWVWSAFRDPQRLWAPIHDRWI